MYVYKYVDYEIKLQRAPKASWPINLIGGDWCDIHRDKGPFPSSVKAVNQYFFYRVMYMNEGIQWALNNGTHKLTVNKQSPSAPAQAQSCCVM